MDVQDERRRWGIEQRLEFIEFCLYWEGGVNRGDIVRRFNISAAQASTDFAEYREIAPGNTEYDVTQKRYVASPTFTPRILKPNADRYLVQLKAIADGIITVEDTPISSPPAVDAMPIPRRRVDPKILKAVVETMRVGRSISVHYHSMNSKRPEPVWRSITPHAFAHDGLRWHIRGFCHLESKFKDFILSRILEVGPRGERGADPTEDRDWNSFFSVILIPNSKLSPSQQKTIALDYDMPDGSMTLRVRLALLYYFNKRLRLDVAQAIDDPKETPVIVKNKREFDQAVKGVS